MRNIIIDLNNNKNCFVQMFFISYYRSNSFFMGANVRKAVADGRGDAVPIFLSEIPLLFYKKIIQPDIAVIQVI